MLIKKKSINSLNFLKGFGEKKLKIFIRIDSIKIKKATKMGFTDKCDVGEILLPKKIGPKTFENAEGYYIVHKDQKKETRFRTIEWHWKQWCGYRKTEDKSKLIDIPYERYPRTFVEPLSIEFLIFEINNEKILSTANDYNLKNNPDEVKMAINILLEVFGECEILDSNFANFKQPKLIKLNWEILPKGEYPWEKRFEQVKPFIKQARKGNQPVIEYRLQLINKFQPDFVAIGQYGFSGYMVYGFTKINIFILESIYINNATYVFDKNWEEFSALTKKEILNKNLQKTRIIHKIENWEIEIKKLF